MPCLMISERRKEQIISSHVQPCYGSNFLGKCRFPHEASQEFIARAVLLILFSRDILDSAPGTEDKVVIRAYWQIRGLTFEGKVFN